ncbi:unnamed protein product, partial [Ceratitis capitata]
RFSQVRAETPPDRERTPKRAQQQHEHKQLSAELRQLEMTEIRKHVATATTNNSKCGGSMAQVESSQTQPVNVAVCNACVCWKQQAKENRKTEKQLAISQI